MENKNFEKQEYDHAPNDIPMHWTNKVVWTEGYNTCLDRTNTKGIYEKSDNLFKAIKAIFSEHEFLYPSDIKKQLEELQTELKKAEQ